MSIQLVRIFDYGEHRHTIYRAHAAGDELPLHQHDDRGHLTLSMSGEIEAFFPDRPPIMAQPGDAPFEFAAGRLHGIRAKTAGALFMNILFLSRY